MIEPRTGNLFSTQSDDAAHYYNQAIDRVLGSETGAAQALDKALSLDSNFTMAAVARYFVAQDTGEQQAEHYRALALQTMNDASVWERLHAEMMIGLIDEPSAWRDKALDYIRSHPRDLLVASKLAGNLFFYDGPKKLDTVLNVFETIEPALKDDWALLARLGFAASEAGQLSRGRELLDRALALRPQSLYSIHGLAHLLHDAGEAEESARVLKQWLTEFESSAREGQLYGHVQWHMALSEFQLGERDAALARYNTYCAPQTTTCGPLLTLADCGGFLLRDYLQTGIAKPLSQDVKSHIDEFWGMIGHPFIALHVAGLFASAEDHAGLSRCHEAIMALPHTTNRDVSFSLVSACRCIAHGHFDNATCTLSTLSKETRIGIGGSNVERILVDLLEARCNQLQ